MVDKNTDLEKAPQTGSTRWLLFGLWLALSLALFSNPIRSLIDFSLTNDDASHILLIPFVSALLLYSERRSIFQQVFYDFPAAALFLLFSALPCVLTLWFGVHWSATDRLAAFTMALVLFWIGGFVLFFGRPTLKAGRFSLLFLFFAVPLPDFFLNRVVLLLQKGSAGLTAALFDLSGVPVLRDGFVFHLGQVNIEVARECSGIRSSLALLILALLVGHFYLRSFWKQTVFILSGIGVMIVKNGVRIVTLTLLAEYVDSDFLFGKLHREGGVVFFLLGLLFLVPVFLLLHCDQDALQGKESAASQQLKLQ